jgi:hypothetical protein
LWYIWNTRVSVAGNEFTSCDISGTHGDRRQFDHKIK